MGHRPPLLIDVVSSPIINKLLATAQYVVPLRSTQLGHSQAEEEQRGTAGTAITPYFYWSNPCATNLARQYRVCCPRAGPDRSPLGWGNTKLESNRLRVWNHGPSQEVRPNQQMQTHCVLCLCRTEIIISNSCNTPPLCLPSFLYIPRHQHHGCP